MTRYTLDNPPDDADYRNPNPLSNIKYPEITAKSQHSEFRMEVVEYFYGRSHNERELCDMVFAFGWDFGWSYRECMEAMVDSGYAYFDPIKGV